MGTDNVMDQVSRSWASAVQRVTLSRCARLEKTLSSLALVWGTPSSSTAARRLRSVALKE